MDAIDSTEDHVAGEQPSATGSAPQTMRAVVRDRYGGPDVLSLQQVDRPVVGPHDVLVKVHASSVTSGDWIVLTGRPYLVRLVYGVFAPKHRIVGMDLAGTVEAVGSAVRRFQPGDEVYGAATAGACAEYVCATEDELAIKPASLTFEEAAAIPIAGCSALQGLRDVGKVQPGQKVLIVGASGGVGTLAVQVAKALGGEVTAVCSTGNVPSMAELGADHVIDYTREDFTRGEVRYDVILDMVGDRSVPDFQRIMTRTGVFVSGASKGHWIGPVTRILRVLVASMLGSQTLTPLVGKTNHADLEALRGMADAGQLRPVVQGRYPLSEVPEAYRAQGAGHARGRRVVTV